MADAAEDTLRRAGSPRIVELLGTPGAGKSTLSALLVPDRSARSTAASGRPVRPAAVAGALRAPLGPSADAALRRVRDRFPPRAAHVLTDLLWRPSGDDPLDVLAGTHPEFLTLIAHAPAPPDADAASVLKWRSWPLSTMATHVTLRRSSAPGRTVLVEEGMVMRANTVCAGDESLVEPYLRHQPVPDVLVILHVDAATALDRVTTRAKRTLLRHEGLGDDGILLDLERSVRLVEAAGSVLRERGVLIIDLDATTSPQQQSETVLRALAPKDRDAR